MLATVDDEVEVPKCVKDGGDEERDTGGRVSVLPILVIGDVVDHEDHLASSVATLRNKTTYDRKGQDHG